MEESACGYNRYQFHLDRLGGEVEDSLRMA